MKSGRLIGFTEAELALILVVVFALIVPRAALERPPDPPPGVEQVRDSVVPDSAPAAQVQARAPAQDTTLRSSADPLCAALPDVVGEPRQPFAAVEILASGYVLGTDTLTLVQLVEVVSPFTARARDLRCRYIMRLVYADDVPSGMTRRLRNAFRARYFFDEPILQ